MYERLLAKLNKQAARSATAARKKSDRPEYDRNPPFLAQILPLLVIIINRYLVLAGVEFELEGGGFLSDSGWSEFLRAAIALRAACLFSFASST